MTIRRTFSLPILLFFAVSSTRGAPAPEILEQGKALYNSAGSCFACHMPDGKGQPGSIPPLAGSEWLSESPGRTIAIALRGLAGPIKVNGKRYYSAMPPQLLFDDEKIALIVTYVNNAWGNEGPEVTAAEVAKARETLPPEVYTSYSIVKAFPFKKELQKRNGPYKPNFDDLLTTVTEPIVYRTFMPGASPAAFAVALPGNQYFCWDAGESRLRYVWTKGGFIRGNQVHWSSNGKPVAEFNGSPYYRARSSLLEPEDYASLADTDRDIPFYDTTEADDFPFVIEGVSEKPKFRGYRLIEGYPEFRSALGQYEIRERIKSTSDNKGIVRTFSVSPATDLTMTLTPSEDAILSTSSGTISAEGKLEIPKSESGHFQITIIEKNPLPAAP